MVPSCLQQRVEVADALEDGVALSPAGESPPPPGGCGEIGPLAIELFQN
jgi:hypothetical protein